ncbi:alpha/beta hydrolase [Solimonas terrae]|uniref:Carboxylesterase n=1 Tax=Solimonas terrae TaxID=1396819 RepID=A0A6M2BVJ5_9GAMM|nr:carboxylesterase [Solimonas terrae]NGY06414.1 carboxylesterase [Solimonas terrae]
MKMIRNADAIVLEPLAPARAAVVWLHGLSADGSDFVPLVPELGLPADAGIRFVFPHAPMRPVTLNGGMPMRAWYDIVGLSTGDAQDDAGIRESERRVRSYLDQQLDTGIAPERLILAGFSQGGAITLHTGLRLPQAIAGLIALSSYVPLHEVLDVEATPAARQMPIFIAHGRQDPVVPYAWGEDSANGLSARGYRVEWHRYAMAHEVCAEEIADIAAFLRKTLL